MNYKVEQIEIDDKCYDILIGKNAYGNEEIIKKGHDESLWFHIDNCSSAHIILQSCGDDIPKRYINEVAKMLFKKFDYVTRGKKVIYTKVKDVKMTNVTGTVTVKNTKTIRF